MTESVSPTSGQDAAGRAHGITVTLTGTGIPRPSAGRAGAGVLVRADSATLQFDAGRGTVLRLADLGVSTADLDALFITHHHSDHCIDVPDMVLSRWIQRAPTPLTVCAPAGELEAFGATMLDPWADDVDIRREVTGRAEPAVDWRSFTAGDEAVVVWSAEGVVVRSARVEHAPVRNAVCFRVEASGRAVVISGDTRVCDQVESIAHGADVLVHEVCLPEVSRRNGDAAVVDYHADAVGVGSLAARAGVAVLMLTHLMPPPETPELVKAYVDAVRAGGFDGRVVVGQDLCTVDVNTHERVTSA